MLAILHFAIALGAAGAGPAQAPEISPANVHMVKLIHASEQEVHKDNDSLDFWFLATVESIVDDRSELISTFLGPKVEWKEGGWLDCDCKYAWYKVEFHLKDGDPIVVEVDPCGQGFKEAIRVLAGKTYTLGPSPAQSRSLRKYFAPLVARQGAIRKMTKDASKKKRGASNPCIDEAPSSQ